MVEADAVGATGRAVLHVAQVRVPVNQHVTPTASAEQGDGVITENKRTRSDREWVCLGV